MFILLSFGNKFDFILFTHLCISSIQTLNYLLNSTEDKIHDFDFPYNYFFFLIFYQFHNSISYLVQFVKSVDSGNRLHHIITLFLILNSSDLSLNHEDQKWHYGDSWRSSSRKGGSQDWVTPIDFQLKWE